MSAEPTIQFQWAGASHSGSRKPKNDDSWVIFTSGKQGAVRREDVGIDNVNTHDLIFAVSDGMGGANAGDMASALILDRMAAMIPDTFRASASGFYPDSLAYLERVIKEVHAQINEAGIFNANQLGMAATLALAWFTPDNLYLANVGDTRIYLYRNNTLEQLSKDHNTVWRQWKRGEINELLYRIHPRRSALYEVVGGGGEHVFPYLAALSYEVGDTFLICSDGVIDGLWERQLESELAKNQEPSSICESLIVRAIENSGVDDTTLILVRILATS